jgi:hypothetical protein
MPSSASYNMKQRVDDTFDAAQVNIKSLAPAPASVLFG